MALVKTQFDIVELQLSSLIPIDMWNSTIEAGNVEEFLELYVKMSVSWEAATKQMVHVVEHPKDWWQHLKYRFAPSWLLKLWPVVVTQYNVRYFYPHIEVPGVDTRDNFATFEVAG